jgi:hypothetical protein
MKALSTTQFAAIHGLAKQTVIRYLKAGRLLGFQIGGQWKIHPDESDRFGAEGLLPLPDDSQSPTS